MKPRFLPPAEFKRIYSRVPRLCVEVVMIGRDGLVLTKRSIPPCVGQWHFPGGTVLMGETLERTVRRVAKAETGVEVKIVRMLGVIEYAFKGYYSRPVGVAFLVRPLASRYRTDRKDASVIRAFKTPPRDMIAKQRAFLVASGVLRSRRPAPAGRKERP
jgi:ADP-ribose pyrophosphatase YjhB (NUDIX family)